MYSFSCLVQFDCEENSLYILESTLSVKEISDQILNKNYLEHKIVIFIKSGFITKMFQVSILYKI